MKNGIVFSNTLPINGPGRSLKVGDVITLDVKNKLMSVCDKHGVRGNFNTSGGWDNKLITPCLDHSQEPFNSYFCEAFNLARLIATTHGLGIKPIEAEDKKFVIYELV